MKTRFCITYRENSVLEINKEDIINKLLKYEYIYDEINPEVVISLGGDGTFLDAVHKYFELSPIFIGVNQGKLGFLCEFEVNDLDKLYELLIKKDFTNIQKNRLISLKHDNKEIYALNEVRIETRDGGSLSMDVFINDELLERLTGDGICFSTSLGSSGISKGLRGALVIPSLNIIEMSEKVPLINKHYSSLNSSIIFNDDTKIRISNFSKSNFYLFFDTKSECLNNVSDIEIELSNLYIKRLKNASITYIDKIKEAFIK